MNQTESAPEPTAAPVILSAHDLFCERDDRVLFSGLNFQLHAGEVLQIKGGNGSGKTTLLRIVCGLNQGYEGELRYLGEPVEEQLDNFRGELLYIGHRVGVNRVLTALENLRWSCRMQVSVSEEQLMQALARVGLRGFEDSQCGALSAGQQQRVALARLLLSPARIWVLDEPFTTLDVAAVALLEKLIMEHAEAGGSVLVTTHHALQIGGLEVLDLG